MKQISCRDWPPTLSSHILTARDGPLYSLENSLYWRRCKKLFVVICTKDIFRETRLFLQPYGVGSQRKKSFEENEKNGKRKKKRKTMLRKFGKNRPKQNLKS